MATRTRIGQRRHYVDFQQPSLTPDGAGGNAKTWSTFASAWGYMQPISGIEDLQGHRLQARVTHEFVTPYLSTVKASHRVLYNGRAMQIREILNLDERGANMKLRLEEGVAT